MLLEVVVSHHLDKQAKYMPVSEHFVVFGSLFLVYLCI